MTYKVGTLVLDMYDTKTNKLMWRGTAVDTVSSKPEKNEKKLEKGLRKCLRNFHPRARINQITELVSESGPESWPDFWESNVGMT
jgi:Domain of unknown function (DUF4136)